jgi:hypothetical protein
LVGERAENSAEMLARESVVRMAFEAAVSMVAMKEQ